jgi:hypothetical protein
MFRPLLKLLSVSFLALFGDPTYLARVATCLVAGALITAVAYWLWPTTLTVWPGGVVMVGAAVVGVAWEWRAEKAAEKTLR